VLSHVRNGIGDMPTQPAPGVMRPGPQEDLVACMNDALDDMRVSLAHSGDGQQRGDLLAPQIQSLIHRATALAGGEV
jgi:hypothetical protein